MSSCLHSRCSQYNNRSGKTRPRHSHRCAGTHESPVHTGYELTRNGSGKRIFTNYNWKLNTDFWEKDALVRCQQVQQMNPTVISNASPMFQKERASFPVPYPTPLSLLSLAAILLPSLFLLSAVLGLHWVLILSQNLSPAFPDDHEYLQPLQLYTDHLHHHQK